MTARKSGLPVRMKQTSQFEIGRGQFGAAVHDHDDRGGFVERDPSLAKDFGRDEIFVFGKDAAGIDDAKCVAAPVGFAVQAVAGDAGFVADDGAPRSDQAIEQRGLADVGPADDGDEWGRIAMS